jgi:hypothetical protein
MHDTYSCVQTLVLLCGSAMHGTTADKGSYLRLPEPWHLIVEHSFVLAMSAQLVQGILATSQDPKQRLPGPQSCGRLETTPGTGSSNLLLDSQQSSHMPANQPS